MTGRRPRGLYITPTQFAQFGMQADPFDQVVTRQKSLDWYYVAPYWLPNPDPVLKKQGQSISIYRDLLSDAHVGGCVRRRKAAVKAMGWQLNRGDCPARIHKAIEDILRDLTTQVPFLPERDGGLQFKSGGILDLIDQALDAPLFGYQPFEVVWRQGSELLAPRLVVGKPPEWFMFNAANELRFRSREHPFAGDELPPNQFLLARQRPTYQNPYGFPDLSLVFWPTVFKRAGLKFWARFTEKYGSPWLVGKHPRGIQPSEVDELLDRLEAMVDDAVAAIPNDSSVEIVEAGGKGASADLYEKFILLCRSETTIALLGQNQSMEKDSTHASALAGQAVTEDIRDDDATLVCGVVNDLVRLIRELNWGPGPCPEFELYAKEQIDNTRATRDKTMKDAGCGFTRKYWLDTYNLDEEHVAEDVPPPPPPPPVPPVAAPDYAAKLAALKARRQGGPEPVAAFAEAVAALGAQDVLDATIDQLAEGGDLQKQAEALLKPVFNALEGLETEDEIAAALLRAYPHMDARALTQTLTRLYFAAELIGRLTVQSELDADPPGDKPALFAAPPLPPIHIHVDARQSGTRKIVKQPDGSLLLQDVPPPAFTTEDNNP